MRDASGAFEEGMQPGASVAHAHQPCERTIFPDYLPAPMSALPVRCAHQPPAQLSKLARAYLVCCHTLILISCPSGGAWWTAPGLAPSAPTTTHPATKVHPAGSCQHPPLGISLPSLPGATSPALRAARLTSASAEPAGRRMWPAPSAAGAVWPRVGWGASGDRLCSAVYSFCCRFCSVSHVLWLALLSGVL